MIPRIGLGHDTHRLEPAPSGDTGLTLAGVAVPSPWRAVAHSDGDAVLHALADALLGALGQGDIGDLFPDTTAKNKGRPSTDFLAEALCRMREAGYGLANVDVIIHLEKPHLGPLKERMRARLAGLLDLPLDRVGLKAKTAEGLGAVGRGEAVAAQAAALLVALPGGNGLERKRHDRPHP